MPSGNNRRLENVFYVFKNMEFFIPSTNPLPWCLFRGDCRFGVMAGAHVTVVSINDLLSFHEEVCEKEKKKQSGYRRSRKGRLYARVRVGAGAIFGGPEG